MSEPSLPRQSSGLRVMIIAVGIILAVPVGLVGIAFFAPQWLPFPRVWPEHYAVMALKQLASLQQSNRKAGEEFWVGDVAGLKGGSIEPDVLGADASLHKPRPYHGYVFRAVPMIETPDKTLRPFDRGEGRNPDRFAICAFPVARRERERNTFLVDESGTVWFQDTDGKPVDFFPLDTWRAGWRKVQGP
jgi:hypothetical protein